MEGNQEMASDLIAKKLSNAGVLCALLAVGWSTERTDQLVLLQHGHHNAAPSSLMHVFPSAISS